MSDKMSRRGLIQRFVAVAAAVTLAPKVEPVQAAEPAPTASLHVDGDTVTIRGNLRVISPTGRDMLTAIEQPDPVFSAPTSSTLRLSNSEPMVFKNTANLDSAVADDLYCSTCDEVFHTRAQKIEHVKAMKAQSDLNFSESAIQHGDGPTGWSTEAGDYIYMIDGVRVPFSFEWMQADCAARGCWLKRDVWPNYWGQQGVNYGHSGFGAPGYQAPDVHDPDHLTRVDAWRRSLHESGG